VAHFVGKTCSSPRARLSTRSVMEEYYTQYGTVLALIVAGGALVAVAFTLNRVVRPDKKYGAKLSTYECGLDPVGTGWSQTHIRYYLFAFMFVVFDVETLFVFPWAVHLGAAGDAQGFILGVMLVFLFFVTLTLPYEYKKGVLKWV
jgi:NADH-quinone oxidoreductase subunit A